MHPMIVVAALVAASSLPKSASIVPPQPGAAWAVGNVRVVFADHHAEFWTRQGHAIQPGVSSMGLVGWVVAKSDDKHRIHRANVLRVCWPDGHHRDFEANMAFIERWMFSPDGSTVILRFRGTHGPENFAEYDVATGKLLREADDQMNDDAPDWALAVKSG
jgi:hypothetical protein